MTLFFIRHAQTDETRVAGWTNEPLTDTGNKQVQEVLAYFKKEYPTLDIRQIVSSDLTRARQTAEQMARLTGVPLSVNQAWRSFNIGSSAGMHYKEFMETHPGFDIKKMEPDESIDGGETPRQFLTRIHTALQELLKNIPEQGDIFVVAHRSVIEVVYALMNQIDWLKNREYPFMNYLVINKIPIEPQKPYISATFMTPWICN